MANKKQTDDPLNNLLAAAGPEILRYYVSGLGNLNVNATRKEYARQAKVMARIRRVYLDILKSGPRWRDFAGKIKRQNLRRPALQEEFAGAMPDRRELP